MKRGLALVLLLAGCGEGAPQQAGGPGARLEAAAAGLGLVPDVRGQSLTGSWATDTDRACVVPLSGGVGRIGVMVDYGDAQGCAASGTVRRDGERLEVSLGGDGGGDGAAACRFRARFDGVRIAFPAELPAACLTLCTGRATLDAFAVERVSQSRSEAETLRTPGGRLLCPAG